MIDTLLKRHTSMAAHETFCGCGDIISESEQMYCAHPGCKARVCLSCMKLCEDCCKPLCAPHASIVDGEPACQACKERWQAALSVAGMNVAKLQGEILEMRISPDTAAERLREIAESLEAA